MKSAVETLSPTRVKLTVEVPFDELEPSVDAAYRKVGQQVRIPGFRPGKVPPRIARPARRSRRRCSTRPSTRPPAVLRRRRRARTSSSRSVSPRSRSPSSTTARQLTFTAEVDVRPRSSCPNYDGLPVTVDDADVHRRRRRRAARGLARPVRHAHVASSGRSRPATSSASTCPRRVDGETARGRAPPAPVLRGRQRRSGRRPRRRDLGLSAGESAEFDTQLGGRGALVPTTGRALVTVRRCVQSSSRPRRRVRPEASEFDTLDELRADLRTRLERVKRLDQGVQARDKVLEALLAKVEIPLARAHGRSRDRGPA